MPVVTFSPGTPSSIAAIVNATEGLAFEATLISNTPTLLVLTQGDIRYELTGVGITFGSVGGNPVLTGGVFDDLRVFNAGALQMTINDLGVDALTFQSAVVSEQNNSDTAALESLFLNLSWTYNGQGNADILPANATSVDGVPLNLAGNDRFFGNGGNDNLFLGDGNDQGQGGSGADKLLGGDGNDKLYGGTGNDKLTGGDGDDYLNGGKDVDALFGGAGADKLDGDSGDDELSGGGGADTFRFARGDGDDRILGFDVNSDVIDFDNNPSFALSRSGGDTLVTYGADSFLLVGVRFANADLIDFI